MLSKCANPECVQVFGICTKEIFHLSPTCHAQATTAA